MGTEEATPEPVVEAALKSALKSGNKNEVSVRAEDEREWFSSMESIQPVSVC